MTALRTGVYVCHCGSNIAGKIDVAEVAHASARPPLARVHRAPQRLSRAPGMRTTRLKLVP